MRQNNDNHRRQIEYGNIFKTREEHSCHKCLRRRFNKKNRRSIRRIVLMYLKRIEMINYLAKELQKSPEMKTQMSQAEKALVPRIAKEDGKLRMTARASNIATWFIYNFPEHAGKLINVRLIREEILDGLKLVVADVSGDLKAHGHAWGNGKQGLGLDNEEVNGERYIVMSLINMVRCSRYLLGKGRKVGALSLLNASPVIDTVVLG